MLEIQLAFLTGDAVTDIVDENNRTRLSGDNFEGSDGVDSTSWRRNRRRSSGLLRARFSSYG